MGSTKVGKQKRFLEHNISAPPFKVFKDSNSHEAHKCWKIDSESDIQKPIQLGCWNSEKSTNEKFGIIPAAAPSECLQTRSISGQGQSEVQFQPSNSSNCKETSTFDGKLDGLNRLQEGPENDTIAVSLVAIDSPSEWRRLLFMLILQSILKSEGQRSLSLPVLVGDKELDVFQLHQKVKELKINGSLSSEEWEQVATFFGFASKYGSNLKSIYTAYLKPMESRQLLEFHGGKVTEMLANTIQEIVAECSSVKQDCGVSSTAKLAANMELCSELRPCECEKFEGIHCLEHEELCSFNNGSVTPVNNLDNEKKELFERMPLPSTGAEGKCLLNRYCEPYVSARQSPIRGQLQLSTQGQRWQECNHEIGEVKVIERSNEDILHNGRHDPLKDALQWMKIVALNPGDVIQGQGPRGSRQTKQWGDECTITLLNVRSCLLKKTETLRDSHMNKADHAHFRKYYEKGISEPHNSTDRLTVSRNLKNIPDRLIIDLDMKPLTGLHGNIKSLRLPAKLHRVSDLISHGTFRKRVPIGPDFQADFPPCSPQTDPILKIYKGSTSCASDDFGRWLGRQVWPLPGGKRVTNKERVGRGRPPGCRCPNPESSACHRLHIRSERAQLKSEIDDAFSIWGFDEMGENASAYWTKEQQETFQVIIKTNPASAEKNFWNELVASFPSRSMGDLVSYYFNIYVLRGREIQNRLHLEEVDSDDDEDELSKEYIKKMNSAHSFLRQGKST